MKIRSYIIFKNTKILKVGQILKIEFNDIKGRDTIEVRIHGKKHWEIFHDHKLQQHLATFAREI